MGRQRPRPLCCLRPAPQPLGVVLITVPRQLARQIASISIALAIPAGAFALLLAITPDDPYAGVTFADPETSECIAPLSPDDNRRVDEIASFPDAPSHPA